MKFKKLASIFLVSALFITGCSNSDTNGGNKGRDGDKNAQVEEVDVVAATVSATQVLDKLDANVIGIPTTKMPLPEKFKGLPEVGQSMSPDLEIVASLKPDIFVMDSMFKDSVEKSMKEYDLNTFYFETGTYTEFIASIEKLGQEINKEKEAINIIKELKKIEDQAKSKNKNGKAPTVAIIFGGGENFMLATETSYLGDLVKTIGGENITNKLEGDMESDYVQFSLEQILEQNPDYVLRFAHGNIEETKKSFDDAFDKNPAYKELDAYKNGKIIDLDPAIFNVSANLSVKEAITTLGNILYGK